MTLLFDRLISDSGFELARLFDDARYDDEFPEDESVKPNRRSTQSTESQLR